MKIILLSDFVRYVYLKPSDEDAEDKTKNEYKVYTQDMSVKCDDHHIECPPIIKQMIIEATNVKSGDIYPQYKFEKRPDIPELTLVRALKKYPQAAKSDKEKVLRVDQGAEYFGSTMTLVDASGKEADASDYEPIKKLFEDVDGLTDKADLLVLCDKNAELRAYIKNNQDTLKNKFEKAKKAIVIGIKEGVVDKDWLNVLADSLSSVDKNKCIMILMADDLRNAGLNITEHGTIEQNIREIVGYLDEDEEPLKTIWNNICQHLVVIFRENQVLYLNKEDSYGSYHYCPHFDRPAQIRPVQFGKMSGKLTIYMLSIIKYLPDDNALSADNNTHHKSPLDTDSIEKALRFGVSAYNQYFKKGYCSKDKDKDKDNLNPFKAITEAVKKDSDQSLYNDSFNEEEFHISSLKFDINRIKIDIAKIKANKYNYLKYKYEKWSRTDALFDYYKDKYKNEEYVLHKIVTDGLEAVTLKLKPSPSKLEPFADYKIICPHLELGDQKNIKIIDEDHMNGFIDLTQLIRTYLGPHNKSEQPLCIAVFGPPGEGKSFSIKQIIKHISPERKSEDKTFNLAQFNSIDQLTEAFHQIQD